MKTLLQGSSSDAREEILNILSRSKRIKQVAVFLNSENFLITNFEPMTNSVSLILEDISGNQIHIEGANCGYKGEAPRTTVFILESIGLKCSDIDNLIFNNNGLQFCISPTNTIEQTSLNTQVLFISNNDVRNLNRLVANNSVDVDIKRKNIMLFNPQYNNFSGLITAISYMDIYEFEYFIGENSPLENGYRFDMDFPHEYAKRIKRNYVSELDMRNLQGVSLVLRGKKFNVACLIEKACAMQVIDTIHCMIFKETLFKDIGNDNYSTRSLIIKAFHSLVSHKPMQLHEIKKAPAKESLL